MKLALNLSVFLFSLFSFSNELFSLTDYQIKDFAQRREEYLYVSKIYKRKNLISKKES